MALDKEGYKTQFHGTARLGADTDNEGYLLIEGGEGTPAGTKNISANYANSENDALDNQELVGSLISIAGGIANFGVNNFTVKWTV